MEYVERLFDMVRRNLPDGFAGRFVCFTDRPADLSIPGIEVAVPEQILPGWWAKLQLFDPKLQELLGIAKGDRVWYFDLDTVIVGQLDRIFEYPGAFALLEDVYRPGWFQSSVMSWIAGTPLVNSIWNLWQANGCPLPHGGDQAVLEKFWSEWLPAAIGGKPWPPDLLQQLFPGALRSYKVECVWSPPKGTSVVFFHGPPRPHEVLTGWVPMIWNRGLETTASFQSVATVPVNQYLKHVAHNIEQDYAQLAATPRHDQLAVICGGGPSLEDHAGMVAALQKGGALVFSLNNVDTFLRDRGVLPNFHVMLDGREELAEWVNEGGIKLYASMCDPKVLEAGDKLGDLVMWHPFTEGIDKVLKWKALLVGGGETVGTRAMALAYIMGFRRIMCFGFDSSYRKSAHHAYGQALNDGDRPLDAVIGGKRFKAAAWMVKQAEDWKEMALALMAQGCEISVTGDGLIAAVVESMNSETVAIDGFEWPSRDTKTRQSVLGTLQDLEKYIDLCKHKRVAVQAGGNVGVWPKELSRHFEQVYTFEPDSVNYGCMARNVRESNVIMQAAALGEAVGMAAIARDPLNCGASALAMGNQFPVITLDSLHLENVDLIQLDVEGYELFALRGAADTIRRNDALIVLELKGLGAKYGYLDSEVDQFLKGFGYHRIGVAHRDVIYQRK